MGKDRLIREDRKKEKPKKQKERPVELIDVQKFYDGIVCGHKACGNKKTQCPECHRINAIGNVELIQRIGFVHLERLNKFNIDEFLQFPENIRKNKTLQIYYTY